MLNCLSLFSGMPLVYQRMILIAALIIFAVAAAFIGRAVKDRIRRSKGLPSGKRGGSSEQVQMDTLAYSSRMIGWSPLGKLFLALALIISGLVTKSAAVPLITFIIGLSLMAYSTNMKIPPLIGLAIGEAMLIMVIGCGMISIMGSPAETPIWDAKILWFHVHMTASSFNQAWLVFFRAVAGVTLMLAFATSTPIPHLAQALRQMRIPKEIIEIVVLIYRYSFLLLERMQTMYNAAHGRLGFNGIGRSLRTTAGIAAGMFSSSMEMGDKAQTALDCRNYNGMFPIFREPGRMGAKWIIVSLSAAIALAAAGWYTDGWIDFCTFFFGGV